MLKNKTIRVKLSYCVAFKNEFIPMQMTLYYEKCLI